MAKREPSAPPNQASPTSENPEPPPADVLDKQAQEHWERWVAKHADLPREHWVERGWNSGNDKDKQTSIRAQAHAEQLEKEKAKVRQQLSGKEASQPEPPGLQFVPGGFVWQGRPCKLSGKPLAVLQAIAESRWKRQSARELGRHCWQDDYEEQNIKDAISKARRALRLAIGKPEIDPLPCVDRGSDHLAWELRIPTA